MSHVLKVSLVTMTLEFNKVQNVWEKKHFKKQQIARKVKILELRNTPRRYFMKLPLKKV